MPEDIEKAYESHLLECSTCLTRAEAAEQALRSLGCFQGGIRELRELLRKREGEGVVIPFHVGRAGLWAAQREWMKHDGPIQELNQALAEIDLLERELKAIAASLDGSHPGGR